MEEIRFKSLGKKRKGKRRPLKSAESLNSLSFNFNKFPSCRAKCRTFKCRARNEILFTRIVKLLSEISFRDTKAREVCSGLLITRNREWRHAKLKPGIRVVRYTRNCMRNPSGFQAARIVMASFGLFFERNAFIWISSTALYGEWSLKQNGD
ncbi:hypothetical protein PUN28_001660 [Cardiocondyla obscurior]|uniref:Ribosomal protein S14 n=1 Tax=Cardiocondyla obscurior TaxID=286306 RepID=A0AAW2GQK2_9HYME